MSRRSLSGKRWAAVRREVLERDGWRCQGCGRAGRLEVDHVVPLAAGGEPWALDNLQALCVGCHIAKTARENERPRSAERQRWDALLSDIRITATPEVTRDGTPEGDAPRERDQAAAQ